MLQFQIENVTKAFDSGFTLEASGWLADTDGKPTEIHVEGIGAVGSDFDVVRTARPDVASILKNAGKTSGFKLVLHADRSDDLKLVFSAGDDKVAFEAASLEAFQSGLTVKLPWRVRFGKALRTTYAYFLYALTSPLRLLKRFKNFLFIVCPSFQRFYMKHIFVLWAHDFPVEEVSSDCPCYPWGEHLILCSHFADGTGAPLLALNIARELRGFGFNLHIVLLRDGELHGRFCQYGSVDVVHSEKEFESLLSEWRDFKIRKAFLNTTLSGVYAGLLKKHGISPVTLIHEMTGTLAQMGYTDCAPSVIQASDRIVIPSTLIADDWAAQGVKFPPERTVVMPQPDYHNDLIPLFSTEDRCKRYLELRRSLKIPEDALIVMGCGSLEERKAPDVFFRTAAAVVEHNPKVYFIWVGDAGASFYKRKLELLILPVENNVRLLHYGSLNPYYYGADLFFLPSRSDPFPTVALLAAKVALPVVFCRSASGIRDFFGEIEGCSISAYSESDFIPLLQRLLRDRAFRESRGALFRKIYHERSYTFRSYALKLYELSGGSIPRVTAVIPNYNYAAYLPARLGSVAEQTFPVHEVLILDDCSTDNSAEVISGLLEKYRTAFPGGIRFLPNQENAGVFRQWMKGVDNASGELIWIAEADDSCDPGMLAALVHAFEYDKKVQLAYAQSKLIDSDGVVYSDSFTQHTYQISTAKWHQAYIQDSSTEIETALAIKNTIPNASAVLVRKDAFKKIPDELFSYRVIGDWFAYLHLIQGGRVAFYPVPLNLYRRHRESVVAKNIPLLLSELLRLNTYIAQKFPISRYTVREMKKEYLRNCESLHFPDRESNRFDQLENEIGEKKAVYIFVPGDSYEPSILKKKLEETEADFAFICLEDVKANLPPDVTEAFSGVVHILWKNEIKQPLALRDFKLLNG